jgi:hypothetical protein
VSGRDDTMDAIYCCQAFVCVTVRVNLEARNGAAAPWPTTSVLERAGTLDWLCAEIITARRYDAALLSTSRQTTTRYNACKQGANICVCTWSLVRVYQARLRHAADPVLLFCAGALEALTTPFATPFLVCAPQTSAVDIISPLSMFRAL